jgi:hypothetical protein
MGTACVHEHKYGPGTHPTVNHPKNGVQRKTVVWRRVGVGAKDDLGRGVVWAQTITGDFFPGQSGRYIEHNMPREAKKRTTTHARTCILVPVDRYKVIGAAQAASVPRVVHQNNATSLQLLTK